MEPKARLFIICTVLTVLYHAVAVVSEEVVKLNATQTTYVEVNKSLVLNCSYEGNSTPKACSFVKNDVTYASVIVPECQYIPSSNFTVTCVGIDICVLTLLRTGVEEHGVKWRCEFRGRVDFISSNSTEIKVKVPVSSVMLSSPSESQVTLAENSTKDFRCQTSASRPIPTLSWFMDNNTQTTTDDLPVSHNVSQSPAAGSEDFVATNGLLNYTASRLANGKYVFCQSRDDDGDVMVSDRRILLDVTYKPDRGPLITNYTNNYVYYAIMNKPQVLACTIPGGNPLASISWSCFTGDEDNLSSGQMVSKRWTWRASSNGTCTCISTHLGVDENVVLKVAILSPPSYPKFTVHSQTVEGRTTFKIIRDSTEPIICTADSVPAPDTFAWKYDGHTSALSQVTSLYPLQMVDDGRYFCEVGNTMSPTQGQIEYGNSTNYIDIERLFSPLVTTFSVGPVVEGDPFSVECKTVPGNPATTTYSWQRKLQSESVWTSLPSWDVSGSHLTSKEKISRHDAGTYKCTASNVMKPTIVQQQIGSSSETFILNVLYKTSISRFIELNNMLSEEVMVHEHSSIHLQCEVDSNPGSTITISKDGEIKVSLAERQQISFINSKVACDTAGTYKCIGYNAYNIEENKPAKDLKLLVTCSPRLSSIKDFKKNITSALNEAAILKISIVAYPVPEESDYTWWKWNGKTWDQVKTGNNIHINTSGLESSVIFHSVQETDYQRYRLNVSNDYGNFHQEVFLNPYGTPELPKNVGFNEESVSQSTVQISWNPGFNGGLEQTFVVLYKKNKESTWLHVTKVDEKTESINVTLKDLASGTTYEFQMYSRNFLGNSSHTEVYTFSTLETKGQVPAALIGGAVGGSVVVIILIAVIVVVFLRKSNFKKGKSKNASDRSDMKPVYEDDDDDGMQDNPMYVSAGPRNVNSNTGACSSEGAVEYSTVNKAVKTIDTVNDNEYAVVSKPKQALTKPGKKEKKHGFFKDKKGKGAVPEGDVYENSPASEMKVVIKKEETNYDNHEASVQKKNVNKDGLLYADLSFNDQPKGQRKLVIHGLDSMTEYVEVDFTKKADPLPDSDDENIPPNN